MYYLIYLSSATSLYTDTDLKDILTKSRHNNESKGITGVLLYHDGAILQVLEGEELSVTNCYHRILLDKRHSGAIMMKNGNNEERYFPDWTMGFKKLSNNEWNTISGYLPANSSSVRFDHITGAAPEMISLIKSFCQANFRF